MKKKGTSTLKVPDNEEQIFKVPKQVERCFFADLTEDQLMASFCTARKFRLVLCKVFLSYHNEASQRCVRMASRTYTFDLPKGTAHSKVPGSCRQLFGSIKAAAFSLDPASPPFHIFNHKYSAPIDVHKLGCLSPPCISYCSIPFSTSVKIAARLYVTTDDNMVDLETSFDDYCRSKPEPQMFNDAFEVCNDSAVISFSDYFANRPNGGSGSYTLKGRDGYLKLDYVALKHAVDAVLEVVFDAPSEQTKVVGKVMAYYGNKFDYGCSPAELDDYKTIVYETEQPEVMSGKMNLMQSVLSVPAQFSLIIDANLTDSTSGAIILSGVWEFFVPVDGCISPGRIQGKDCALNLKVDWKFAEETTLAKRSYYSDLTKKQIFSQRSSVRKDKEAHRWSLLKSIYSACKFFLLDNFYLDGNQPSVSISTGTKADNCDYLCTSILNIWPEIRSHSFQRGPKGAALVVRDVAVDSELADMLERCVVGGPGFLKFKLSRTYIAESLFLMILRGVSTWAPNKIPMKKAIIDFLPRNIAKEMHMHHLQSTIIGETLALVLDHSRVRVRQRFQYGDYLDTKSKMMMTEFLIDRFPDGEVNDQAIGELEVLYEESKKRFVEDAEFRERIQPVQKWDKRHKIAWKNICSISRERYKKVYQRLGVRMKEEGERLHDFYISEALDKLREKGFNTNSEGDEVIIEGRCLPLVDFAALWHGLEIEKPDRIVRVADVGQRDKIETCINVAERVGLSVTNHCHDPVSHVGFGLLEVEDVKGLGLLQLLDEAKSRCKAVLGVKDKEREHTAEALGYGAVKYEVLKNNRLANCTFRFNDMLKKTGNTVVYLQHTHARICLDMRISGRNLVELMGKLDLTTLKDDRERQLGLHVLRFTQGKLDLTTLKDDRERQLGLHVLRFTQVLGEVCRVLAPHIMCDYLFVLCKKINRLYSESWQKVQSGEDSKMLLCEATRRVIEACFFFMGITPIYKKF